MAVTVRCNRCPFEVSMPRLPAALEILGQHSRRHDQTPSPLEWLEARGELPVHTDRYGDVRKPSVFADAAPLKP